MSTLIDGILETALYARDLDAAEAFYSGVLGLERVFRHGDRHVFFRCGPGILLVFNPDESVKQPAQGSLPVPPHGTTGHGHACFRVGRDRIDEIAQRLTQAGTAIEADFHWPNGARSIYFRDPGGNSLECAEPALWGID